MSRDGNDLYVATDAGIVALRRDARTGALRQPAGTAGCVIEGAGENCADGRTAEHAADVTLTRDGRHLYAAFFGDSVGAFDRLPAGGGLAQLPGPDGCVGPDEAGCRPVRQLREPASLIVSPDGGYLYAASSESNAVVILRRDKATGALTQGTAAGGCVRQRGGGSCGAGRALSGVETLAMSSDGRSVYAGTGVGIAVFRRDARLGTLSQASGKTGCLLNHRSKGCALVRGLSDVGGIEVSPDGRNVYVVAGSEIAILRRSRR